MDTMTAPSASDAVADAHEISESDLYALADDGLNDAQLYALVAAPDGRGNLARLIVYWTVGKGRTRVRWGSSGDFTRCVRILAQYVPAHMLKGFCARLHRLATGRWPGRGREH